MSTSDILYSLSTEEDLDEMAQNFTSSSCMYGFCRVRDPTTNLNKLVLINWVSAASTTLALYSAKTSIKVILFSHVCITFWRKGENRIKLEDDISLPKTLLSDLHLVLLTRKSGKVVDELL
jgi:hypothetical protein